MAEGHSFGPTCIYHESDSDDNDTLNTPKVKAQFFYISDLPIDDPLSPVPPTPAADKTPEYQPQPFSIHDSAALEEAWQGLHNAQEEFSARPGSRGLHRMFSFPKFKSGQSPTPEMTSPLLDSTNPSASEMSDVKISQMQQKSSGRLNRKPSSRSGSPIISRKASERAGIPRSIPELPSAAELMLDDKAGSLPDLDRSVSPPDMESGDSVNGSSVRRRKHRSPLRTRHRKGSKQGREISPFVEEQTIMNGTKGTHEIDFAGAQAETEAETSMSGRPFARAPSSPQIRKISLENSIDTLHKLSRHDSKNGEANVKNTTDDDPAKVFVPVGVSRLHLVEFPELMMKPIYWNPINDTSRVIRATWFYKDSMLPVPADIANLLEIGYEDLKPYSSSYKDELDACTEHGAAAELKIVHKLWPEEVKISSRPNTGNFDKTQDEQSQDIIHHLPEASENIAVDPKPPNSKRRLFESYSVIYIDKTNAQILRPSALPSESRNRKPLGSIRKGRQLGIAVVRGFDYEAWAKLHPNPNMRQKVSHAKSGAEMSRSGDAAIRSSRLSCTICDQDTKQSTVSDLVLVIHGIGQKLSERMDSFHFTHAINGLRREFNVQLSQNNVKGTVRADAGIMVLPVNWRLTVSFDDDIKRSRATTNSEYKLSDITPTTLPAVRSLISDVMLDIPYYMSHHKQKMISAVVREANRVYRLWCQNNPGFQEHGRVHLIAHSLGAAMATDILSQQPTEIPRELDLTSGQPSDSMFEFKTTNLFCCGSPSGFFLLLNGAGLVPRKGLNKPDLEGEDYAPGVAGEAGQYGCLAVDNLYNILHKNDPIAYQQNACVDSNYAGLLETATIPSATLGLFDRFTGSLRWSTATIESTDAYGRRPTSTQRPPIASMPSTVELDTHNFTREEIAEKRMYLMNENGQIDFFLQSGGGPLEIQYLNMLSAHSSYWILQDFVRFLVVEIGRKPGKENTLPVLRAVKKRVYKRGEV